MITQNNAINREIGVEFRVYSKNSLYQMHSQGKVPGAHKVGSKLMFDTATLREWAEKGGGK